MTSPYSTPRYPRGPNPTPHSTQKGLRPPIHNPYDKFTQPEFDAWITGITGALKHALGREEPPPLRKREASHPEEDEGVDDSFAEVKARRLAKGKERARDEDFEQEETRETQEDGQDEDDWGEAYDGEEYSSEETGESEEEAPHVGHSAQAEVINLLSDDEDAHVEDYDAVGVEEDGEEEDAEEYEYEEEAGSEAGSDDAASPKSSPAAGPSNLPQSPTHDVTEILDSEEEPEDTVKHLEERSLPARFQRKPVLEASGHLTSDEEADYEEDVDHEQVEEEEDPFPPRDKEPEHVDVEDPWHGPATYAEDFYSGGDIPSGVSSRGNPHKLPTEEDEDALVEGEFAQGLDLPDPWEGPRQFAEDFYAGGDALLDPQGLTPSHLTPKDEGDLVIPGITAAPEHPGTEEATPASPQMVDADDLYADVDEHDLNVAAPAQEVQDDDSKLYSSPPSPPSATLHDHVDWNWPPAFPGLVATRSGHVDVSEQEVFEISDEEEDQLATSPAPTTEPVMVVDEVPKFTPAATDDTSRLYGEFDDLYDIGPPGAPFDLQGPFEPISPPGLDFGELPAFAQGYPASDVDASFTELDATEAPPSLENVVAMAAAAIEQETVPGLVLNDDERQASPEPQRPSVSFEEFTDDYEPEHQSSPIAEVGVSAAVAVIEPNENEDEDIKSSASPETTTDISSVRRDAQVEVSAVDYAVAEVLSEGRRIEEQELAVWEQYEGSSRNTPGESLEGTNSTTVDAQAERSAPNGVLEKDDPMDLKPTKSEDPHAPMSPHDAPAPIAVPAPLERTRSSLSSTTDFPPPISANPDVPDPASLSHTPLSPASPAQVQSEPTSPTRASHDANSFPANAALHPLFRKLASETAHSPSGLFTPLPDSASASVTPENRPSPIFTGSEGGIQLDDDEDDILEADVVPLVAHSEEVDELADEAVELTAEVELAAEPAEPVEVSAELVEPSEKGPEVTSHDDVPQEQVSSKVEAYDIYQGPASDTYAVEQSMRARSVTAEPAAGDIVAVDLAADPRDATPSTDADADAEGEVDPEYHSEAEEPVAAASTDALESSVAIDDENEKLGSPAAIKENEELNGAAEESANESEHIAKLDSAEQAAEEPVTIPAAPSESDSIVDATAPLEPIVEEKTVPSPSSPTEGEPATGAVEEEVRPLKRKRGSAAPATRIPRLTRSKTSQSVQRAFMDRVSQKAAKPKGTKGKGKGKAAAQSEEEDDASVAHSHSGESSTSGGSSAAAQQMLLPDSRGTSRASSVVSNAPSAYSGLSQPSPTIDRVLPNNGHNGPPPPFIHNHGILHHHHGRPMAPVVPVVQKRTPSASPAPASESGQRASAEPGPSSQPLPVKATPVSSISSPVTRSNCRFHTISVPQEEGSPRILFAVPGCSLSNTEFMKDEEIEDQGYVKPDDVPRLMRDVESLKFSPYMVGVLRQLVGVDLLREQEVFYIPRAGDGVVLRAQHKSHRAKLKQRESISARTLSSGGQLSRTGSAMAPPSQASVSTSGDSVSTAGRLSQRGSVATSGSLSGSDLSDLEDEEAPPTKRAKGEDAAPEPVGAETVDLDADATSPADGAAPVDDNASNVTATAKSRKLQPRRSRRLGPDASAYKPDGGESDGSGEDVEGEGKKKRKKGKRGLKRTRTEENGEVGAEGVAEKPKRRRVRASTSANGSKAPPDVN
ncbi:hypothetical protein C2E23DRAFT_901308 [Lenzites betulinus]|nr:hypothetical protein C2E23DRAFT_901308 [Lenzites betulinus]